MLLCVVTVFAGCSKSVGTGVSNPNLANSENLISMQKLNIDGTDHPIGISGNYFYYMSELEYTDNSCEHAIMRYDLTTREAVNIGKINNLSTWSATYAFLDCDTFFSVFGTVENDVEVNQHIMVNTRKGSVSVLKSDNFFPPLVQSVAISENSFLEFQPQQLDDGTYKYIIRLGDFDGKTKDIIVKEQGANGKGEMIVDVCVYANVIYTFEYEAQKAYICSYDSSGNQITKENIELINEFLSTPNEITGDNETIWSMDVINGYYFFKTLNGKRLALFKGENGWKKTDNLIMNQIGESSDLVVNVNSLDEKYKKVLLFDYDTKNLFCLDTDNAKIENFNLNLKSATYCMTDGKQLVFQNDKKEFYYIADVFAK